MPFTNETLLIVSNRLPAVITEIDGQWKVVPGSGGLVTALTPLMKANHGIWLGWPGCTEEAPIASLLRKYSDEVGYKLRPVIISEEEIEQYYRGFANQAVWPLFHDLLGYCRFDADQWGAYLAVNKRFAQEIVGLIKKQHFVWVHDYQLLAVGHYLRAMGINGLLNFFMHIPFPAYDLFRRLPWRQELLEAMLEYDHIGFQTASDRRNFIQCVKTMVPHSEVRIYARQSEIDLGGRRIKLGIYPISIDFAEFDSGARTREAADAAWYVQENIPEVKLMLGLDRLDYTKGIGDRFLAFERALEKYPELRKKLSLIQIVVPSRLNAPQYQDSKTELDQLAGRINGRFSRDGWVPIHYMFRHLERTQLLGYYRACEIALVTPLRDGMNLVSKEFCAASVENNGVLILSEFAGAADQLAKGALMVNPYDIESTADAIYAAYIMSPQEREARMKVLRDEVKTNDVHAWVRWFLESDVINKDAAVPISEARGQESE